MAQQTFNSAVHYVRNGVSIPAIVLQSRFVTEQITVPNQPNPLLKTDKTTERLTLLFADPATGPGLVNGGKAATVGRTEFNVRPLEPGMTNGWKEFGPVAEEIKAPIAEHLAAVEAVKADPGVEDPTQIVTEAHKGGLMDLPDTVTAIDLRKPLKPFADLTPEEKAAIVYPYGDIVTESGKTQEQLDAEHAQQAALRTEEEKAAATQN